MTHIFILSVRATPFYGGKIHFNLQASRNLSEHVKSKTVAIRAYGTDNILLCWATQTLNTKTESNIRTKAHTWDLDYLPRLKRPASLRDHRIKF